jgi:acyl-CoA thioesterase FadM
MDTMGHVNNTVPFRDMKQARISGFDFPKRESAPLPAAVREAILLPRSGWL